MDKQLYDRDKLMQQLKTVQNVQAVHHVPQVQHDTEGEAVKELARLKATAATGKSEVLKDLYRGADMIEVFLQAAATLSTITNDYAFYDQCVRRLNVLYGEAWNEPQPLERQLAECLERMERLTAYGRSSTTTEDERDEARRAYRAHQDRAEQLKEQIEREKVYKEAAGA